MSEYYKLIAFNVEKAKTPTNPDGLEVITEDGTPVTVVSTNYNSGLKDDEGNNKYPIFVIVHEAKGDVSGAYTINGESCVHYRPNLNLKKSNWYKRTMTCQEVAWWLRDCPEEHREYIYCGDTELQTIYQTFDYVACDANKPVNDILIRSNGGEWEEPIVEEIDYEL